MARLSREYKLYIRSARWKQKRNQALDYYGRRCQVCRTSQRLEVNHLTYKSLFNEPMSDLSILCHSCHQEYGRLRRSMSKRRYSGRFILNMMINKRHKANP